MKKTLNWILLAIVLAALYIPTYANATSKSVEELAAEYNRLKDEYYGAFYLQALEKREAGDWDAAYELFMEAAGHYSDAKEQALITRYEEGLAKFSANDYDGAATAFHQAGEYSDAPEKYKESKYKHAEFLESSGNQQGAYDVFISLGNYEDAFERAKKPYYDLGVEKRSEKKWDEAAAAFKKQQIIKMLI